jgi:receptor protein-tyrosine kinase
VPNHGDSNLHDGDVAGRASGTSPESIESSPLVPRDSGRAIGVSFVRFTPRAPHDPRIVLWSKRGAPAAAAFRRIRQRLIERSDPRIILCTSPKPGEGRTTLATNLALAYAELGRPRVLLIEGSLRAAALSKLFGFKPPIGFGAQLIRHREQPDERWVVAQMGTEPLFVMAARPHACTQCSAVLPDTASFCGRCGTAVNHVAPDALDAGAFAAAVRCFRESFDYLVIDAPPVLASGSVTEVLGVADAVVLATLKGHSRRRDLRRAVEQIAPKPVAAVALLDE